MQFKSPSLNTFLHH